MKLSVLRAKKIIAIFYSLGAVPLIFFPPFNTIAVGIFGLDCNLIFVWIMMYIVSSLTFGPIKIQADMRDGVVVISPDELAKLPDANVSREFPPIETE
jgi:hypothetical protein